MTRVLRMPDVSGGSDEGVLANWLVEESARFDAAQTIAYVETRDELFSVEAGRPGLLLKVLVEPGSRVPPGTPIGILGEPWEQVSDLEGVLAELGLQPRDALTTSSWFDADAPAGAQAEQRSTAVRAAPEPLTLVAELAPPEVESEAAVEVESDSEAEPDPLAVVGHSHLVQAEAAGPLQHQYLRARVRADRLVSIAAQLEREAPGTGVSELVGRAVVAAHRQVPQLVVARMADDKAALPGIAVSHPGRFGVEEAVAVVPDGHAVALAVGAVRDEPVVDGGVVQPGKTLTLTLSIRPGRIEDNQASRWLAVLVALLERPEWLLE